MQRLKCYAKSDSTQRPYQVTVAVVRYESLQRQRIGVTSTYLAERLAVHCLLALASLWHPAGFPLGIQYSCCFYF